MGTVRESKHRWKKSLEAKKKACEICWWSFRLLSFSRRRYRRIVSLRLDLNRNTSLPFIITRVSAGYYTCATQASNIYCGGWSVHYSRHGVCVGGGGIAKNRTDFPPLTPPVIAKDGMEIRSHFGAGFCTLSVVKDATSPHWTVCVPNFVCSTPPLVSLSCGISPNRPYSNSTNKLKGSQYCQYFFDGKCLKEGNNWFCVPQVEASIIYAQIIAVRKEIPMTIQNIQLDHTWARGGGVKGWGMHNAHPLRVKDKSPPLHQKNGYPSQKILDLFYSIHPFLSLWMSLLPSNWEVAAVSKWLKKSFFI